MKNKYFIILFLLIFVCGKVDAQNRKAKNNYLFRFYEDNDRYNLLSKVSDFSYSNGTQINLFYTKATPSKFFIDRAMPKAGDSSINVMGWGLMQIIFTPKDLTTAIFQEDDYPYLGALYVTRSFYSYNPLKKYDFQTELSVGVRGPAALGEGMQKIIHRFVGIKNAKGWDNQLNNKLYANLTIKAEKGLVSYNKLEVIAGGQVFVGTMLNAIGLSSIVRFGKMTPYFNGFLSNYKAASKTEDKNNLQIYLVIKPEIFYTVHYGLLTGKIQTGGVTKKYAPGANKFNHSLNAGVVLAYRNLGFSYNHNSSGPYLRGLYNHDVANFSLYYSW